MEINENMKAFVKNCDNLISNVIKVQTFIKENYNIDSEYNSSNNILHIWNENSENPVFIAQAKEYINSTIGEDFVQVIFGQ